MMNRQWQIEKSSALIEDAKGMLTPTKLFISREKFIFTEVQVPSSNIRLFGTKFYNFSSRLTFTNIRINYSSYRGDGARLESGSWLMQQRTVRSKSSS